VKPEIEAWREGRALMGHSELDVPKGA